MRNAKLSTKLIAGFAAIALVALIVGTVGITRITTIAKTSKKIYEENAININKISGLNENFLKMRAVAISACLERFSQNKDIAARITAMKEMDKTEQGMIQDFEKRLPPGKEAKTLNEFKVELGKYLADRDKMFQLVMENRKEEVIAFINGDLLSQGNKVSALLDKLMAEENGMAKKNADLNNAYGNSAVWFIVIASVAGIMLAAFLGFLFVSIIRPINSGIDGLHEGANQVGEAASLVSSASQNLVEGASQQTTSVEKTSSSAQELAASTKQNADNAKEVDLLMVEATRYVDSCNNQMIPMIAAIQEITRLSTETRKIIKTIDEIAFKTNLLALNAAVETAGAGEAGTGFAVVAEEVRNLAKRAAEAAKNTNSLIDNTVKAVKKGSNLTLSLRDEFRKNQENGIEMRKFFADVQVSSNEQVRKLEQITRIVTAMDKAIIDTAASAEDSAAAAEELNAQAEAMKGFVEELNFVVGGNQQK
ncbi:MAG: methyl-accepting chemotaxis protein [Smithellaceae bacterium]